MKQLIFILSIILVASCGDYNAALKTRNMKEKYAAAKAYYDDNDYLRSLTLFEELLSHYKGTDSSERMYYYYSYCHYGMGNFNEAAYHFKNYTETFFNSDKTEECYFMHAKCTYLNTLPSYLDQTATTQAIEKLQLFVNLFPNSERIPECNGYIDQLRAKLQNKAFENAYLYYKIGSYRSAITSFKNLISDYPDIKNLDQVEYLIVKSAYLFARNSIDKKKEERYEEVFKEFKNISKTSGYYQDAQQLKEKAEKELAKYLRNNI